MQDGDGWGMLWFAQSVEVVDLLIQAGANVHLTNDAGQEALTYQSNIGIQARLIAAGCPLNPPGGAPLMKAVERGDVGQIRFLLEAGAIVNAATGWGQTPLMEAAENSFADGVRLLLSAGADVSLQDLLSARADVPLQERGGRTALHHAAAPEAFTAYTLALETNTPEWRAILAESLPEEIRGLLKEQPVDLGKYGYVKSDSVECLSLLAEAGADINAADAAGLTPLMLTASYGRPSRVAGLLALGADASLCDADGKTARDHALTRPDDEQRTAILGLLH